MMTNTLCPKIGAAQWTCTKDECTCHLKDSIPARYFTRAECETHLRQDIEKVGAAIACATATSPRPSYEEAIKYRPRGACYCDLDDRACYAAGHWEPICKT